MSSWDCEQCGLTNPSSQIACSACFTLKSVEYFTKNQKSLIIYGLIREFSEKFNLQIPNEISNIILFFYTTWNELVSHKTRHIQDRMMSIGNNIYYGTPRHWGENGLVQYNLESHQLSVTEIPSAVGTNYTCCFYKDKIYIISGSFGRILAFNPTDKSFTTLTNNIPVVGQLATCVAIDGVIHILGGKSNTNHVIYSIKDNKITIIPDITAPGPASLCCMVEFEGELLKFGGYDVNGKKTMDGFWRSSCCLNGDKYGDIDVEWKFEKRYRMKYGVCGCGYVIYDGCIFIFGGEMDDDKFTDKIYCLDLRKDEGWKELKHIRCPLASQYRACLDANGNLHLLTRVNIYPESGKSVLKHYCIHFKHVLGDIHINK